MEHINFLSFILILMITCMVFPEFIKRFKILLKKRIERDRESKREMQTQPVGICLDKYKEYFIGD